MGQERVEVKVMGVYGHRVEDGVLQHFVLLRDERGRQMPIWVGQFEAWAITLGLSGEATERPLTHDAMLLCLAAAGATVEEVSINDVRDGTFYSLLSLRVGDNVQEMDLRPSDALALAVRAKCPVFVSEAVMQRTHREPTPGA